MTFVQRWCVFSPCPARTFQMASAEGQLSESNSEISDECPHCKRPFEIVAVDLSLSKGNVAALFVCPDCGMTRPETPDEARRKVRRRIPALENMLKTLKCWTLKSP